MTVKIQLSTGKEIELTEKEFNELKDNFKEIVYQAYPVYSTRPIEPVSYDPVMTYGSPAL